jgi:hypothetical protein
MKYVLAGNHAQFLHWCRENDIDPRHEAVHVHASSLTGVHFPITDFVKVGTWRQRKDIDDLRHYVRAAIWPPTKRCPIFEIVIKTPLFDVDALPTSP